MSEWGFLMSQDADEIRFLWINLPKLKAKKNLTLTDKGTRIKRKNKYMLGER